MTSESSHSFFRECELFVFNNPVIAGVDFVFFTPVTAEPQPTCAGNPSV
jgi:hypothetical protein